MKKVGIVMGSDSDLPVIKKAADQLNALGIPFEVHVYSAHRTPVQARDFAVNARANGFGVIIAAAGMVLDGMDALLSTVQMPSGIPVATVAIDGGANAALLAAQILAVEDASLAAKLDEKRSADAAKVLEKDAGILSRI